METTYGIRVKCKFVGVIANNIHCYPVFLSRNPSYKLPSLPPSIALPFGP